MGNSNTPLSCFNIGSSKQDTLSLEYKLVGMQFICWSSSNKEPQVFNIDCFRSLPLLFVY